MTEAQQQWWEFKASNFDSVLLFKVGKFYEVRRGGGDTRGSLTRVEMVVSLSPSSARRLAGPMCTAPHSTRCSACLLQQPV